ncbi:MAG: nucleotide exchange factor GrpE [Paracoccaceae bacterium]
MVTKKDTTADEEVRTEEAVSRGEAEPGIPEETTPDIDALIAERDDMRDRMLRALAEAENLRKRGERDRRDAETYGGTRLARDLLSVYDNISRALETVTDDMREAAGPMIEGIELTKRELLAVFARHKIEPVNPEIGGRFDPKLHQAMFEAPIPNTEAGSIIQVMTTGFTIGDRLLRPAQVGVSSGGPKVDLSVPEAEAANDDRESANP